MASKGKRNDLTMANKYEAVNLLNQKMSQSEVAKMLGCSQSQISRLASKKHEIVSAYQSNVNLNPARKRQRVGKDADVEEALTHWFMNAREEGIPLSGPIIAEKAKDLAQHLNKEFRPTSGWLTRWKERNNINSFKKFDSWPWVKRRPSFDVNNKDWVPTVNMGHEEIQSMEKHERKEKATLQPSKKRKKVSRLWTPQTERNIDYSNQTLNGSMSVPRVIFDENEECFTLSKFKNLLSLTVTVGQDGYCDISTRMEEGDETAHLELVLLPKVFLDNKLFSSKTNESDNFAVKDEPVDDGYEAACNLSSVDESMSMATESLQEDYSQYHQGFCDGTSNSGTLTSDYVTDSVYTDIDETASDIGNMHKSTAETSLMYVERNPLNINHSESRSIIETSAEYMEIKKEPGEQENENIKEEYSNSYIVKEGNLTFENSDRIKPSSRMKNLASLLSNDQIEKYDNRNKPSILERNLNLLSDDQMFKYLQQSVLIDSSNDFKPWLIDTGTERDVIMFNRMAPTEFPVVARQVVINKDLSHIIKIHTQVLSEHHDVYKLHPTPLRSLNSIKELLKCIDKYRTCSGNNDRRSNHYFLLSDDSPLHPAIREGNFGAKCVDGSTYEWTIRSKFCSLLVPFDLRKCPECNTYNKQAKLAPVPTGNL